MSLLHRLTPVLARLRPGRAQPQGGAPPEPAADPAEEFQKVHRSLRRLGMASDRSAALLEAVGVRVDAIQQTLLKASVPEPPALALEEAEVVRILDQLDRVAAAPGLSPSAHSWVEDIKEILLVRAGWSALALPGSPPEGADIRITEVLGDASVSGQEAVIHRVLEQGYRRADGTLLRPAVVVAASGARRHERLMGEER